MANKKSASKKTAANKPIANNAPSTKALKFVELAQKRTTKAINNIRSVAKLSNRGNYEYTEDQVNKIASVLRDEVVAMHERFTTDPKAEKGGFEL